MQRKMRFVPGEENKLYDPHKLVELVKYTFVHVVKARDLPDTDLCVEVAIGSYKGKTKASDKKPNPEWNQVFALSKDIDKLCPFVEVCIKDKDSSKNDFYGYVIFQVNDIPTRVPPDSALAPEWYRLEDKTRGHVKGELMLSVWIGTQTDVCYANACHMDVCTTLGTSLWKQDLIQAKIYHAPRLWYLSLNIIEAQIINIKDKSKFPDLYVKAQIGNQVIRTRNVASRMPLHFWNEEFMFVVAEPFDDQLVISVVDRVGPDKEEVIGKASINLRPTQRRLRNEVVVPQWLNLEMPDAEQSKKENTVNKIHIRTCLEGGYHVVDESLLYTSDLRPSAKCLWMPALGELRLGICEIKCLVPTKIRDGKGTCDAYCVAKYGHKWVRTRTIVNSLNPKFGEPHTWKVFDPATVLTIGVFDNNSYTSDQKGSNGNKDTRIGKIRIRLSTLEAGRMYKLSFPLFVINPSSLCTKPMGELCLAVQFFPELRLTTMCLYSRPLLPVMHYIRPLNMRLQNMLRHHAINVVAEKLGRTEPPLKNEVVEYMNDVDAQQWSMRKGKANFNRVISVFEGLIGLNSWFREVCSWNRPIVTVLMHLLLMILTCYPDFIVPTVFLYVFILVVCKYRYRPQSPPLMDVRISDAELMNREDLDEEFDNIPSTKGLDEIRKRYDRLRIMAGVVQTTMGNIAAQGERLQALISWRDPFATQILMASCAVAAVASFVAPFRLWVLLYGLYLMRHPRFRNRMPPVAINFFRRLPTRTDCML